MPLLLQSDLRYEYSWKVTAGDNPKLIEDDANHLSRKEGYEMLSYLNNLGKANEGKDIVYGKGDDIQKDTRLYVEWMLKEHFKSTSPGRGTVTKWVNDNWWSLKEKFVSLKPKK